MPDAERKSVYYISNATITKANTGDWGRTWIDGVGADFAVPETDLNGEVTVEKVLEWDPDVIIVQGGSDLNDLYTCLLYTSLSSSKLTLRTTSTFRYPAHMLRASSFTVALAFA